MNRGKDYMNPWNWDREVRSDLQPCALLLGAMAAIVYIAIMVFH